MCLLFPLSKILISDTLKEVIFADSQAFSRLNPWQRPALWHHSIVTGCFGDGVLNTGCSLHFCRNRKVEISFHGSERAKRDHHLLVHSLSNSTGVFKDIFYRYTAKSTFSANWSCQMCWTTVSLKLASFDFGILCYKFCRKAKTRSPLNVQGQI